MQATRGRQPRPTRFWKGGSGITLESALLVRALTHRSYAYENGGLPTNERLEFLGDSVLGLVVTDTLYRTHPDLPEGQLAKLRAAVVNSRALAGVGRGLDLGSFIRLGRGEEGTGGRDKASILADTLEAVIGAVYLDQGLEAAAELVHRLFDPLIEKSSNLGAGLDWKTSLQELTATEGLGVPEYLRHRDADPTTRRPSRAAARVGGSRTAPAPAAARRRPSSRPPEAAWRGVCSADGSTSRGRRAPTERTPCPSCPRSRSSGAAGAGWPAGPSTRDGRCIRARSAGTSPGADDFAARAARPDLGVGASAAASTCGCRSTATATPLLGHLGMSGQLLVQPAGRRRREAPARPVPLRPTRHRAALRRPAHLRRPSLHETSRPRRRCPTPSRTSPATRSTPPSTRTPSPRRCGAAARPVKRALLDQSLISGVGNIYADEALWRARLHYERPTATLTRPAVRRAARPRPGGDERGARRGRHQLRQPVRQRQRRVRLLRPVAGRVRPGGRALRRCGTPIRRGPWMNRSATSARAASRGRGTHAGSPGRAAGPLRRDLRGDRSVGAGRGPRLARRPTPSRTLRSGTPAGPRGARRSRPTCRSAGRAGSPGLARSQSGAPATGPRRRPGTGRHRRKSVACRC